MEENKRPPDRSIPLGVKDTRSGLLRPELRDEFTPLRCTLQFWLRVDADGGERWFREEPSGLLTLRVRVLEHRLPRAWCEETYTRLRWPNGQWGLWEPVVVRPRGDGWSALATIVDGSAVWRRPHDPEAEQPWAK